MQSHEITLRSLPLVAAITAIHKAHGDDPALAISLSELSNMANTYMAAEIGG